MPTHAASADVLGEALQHLRLRGTFYCNPELSAPWGLAVPEFAGMMALLVVTEGDCVLEMPDGKFEALSTGELVLLPHGSPHGLRSDPHAPVTPLLDAPVVKHSPNYETMVFGGGGRITRLIYGVIQVEHPAGAGLVNLLPLMIRLNGFASTSGGWLKPFLQLMQDEARSPKPGGETILTRLTDILVVQAIRHWLETEEAGEHSWLTALRDPKIGRVLLEIHQQPGAAWTVAGLARIAGMSRSAFASRFHELSGEPPMHYVTRWRMQIASSEMLYGQSSTGDIAASLGYASEAAFCRAYKSCTGQTPGSLRKKRRELDAVVLGA